MEGQKGAPEASRMKRSRSAKDLVKQKGSTVVGWITKHTGK